LREICLPDHLTERKSEAASALKQDEPAVLQSQSSRPPSGNHTSRGRRSENPDSIRRRAYEFSSLAAYSFRDRLMIRIADRFFYTLIKLIGSTLRWEVRGMENLDSIFASSHRTIFTFWHTCIFSATWMWRRRGIVVMSSQSRDGEYIARFIKRLGYGTARGSSTRGGGRALSEMSQCLENGLDVAFTIDGPRGPAYQAKTGAVTLARHTGQAILPFYVAVRRRIELPSWDRLQIPLPFTRALTLIAEPIYVARNSSNEELAASQAALQATLDRLRSEGEAWRVSDIT
jgi:lysophospholipid acyltransferase (LPLAT)-like uncharacterized protein